MFKVFFLLIFVLFLQTTQLFAEQSTDIVLTGALKSRKVVGVIHFKKNIVDLSSSQMADIDRIIAKSVVQLEPSKVVRVEGFSSTHTTSPLDVAFSRARSVWQYLERRDAVASDKLYLTGFTDNKYSGKLSSYDRVEIVTYDNPFAEKNDLFSKSE